MKIQSQRTKSGNTIICALTVILIISLIGANVLISCVTRYNVSAKQLKAWKEALYAAEAGGDIAFAEVRKRLSSPGTAFSGWSPAPSPLPTPSWAKGPVTFGQANSLSTTVTVDQLPAASPSPLPSPAYRIRATGTAKLFGLPRAGMDGAFLAGGTNFKDMSNANKANRASSRGVGDTLLRKIDYNYDHFQATYGDGDFNNLSLQTVSYPQITRRIELVAVPEFLSFSGAIKVTANFNGPGSAGIVDSYDSKNGAYYFAANNPSDPHYADARDGDVSVATKNFAEGGPIYGDVTTNGGNVTHTGTQISGTIDNNVPFTIPPLTAPTGSSGWPSGPPTYTISVPVGTNANYVYSSLTTGITITATQGGIPVNQALNKSPLESSVTIVVNGDVAGNITINSNVNAKIYFTGNMTTTSGATVTNNNSDNYSMVPGNPSRAAHLGFFGISPTDGTTRTIAVDPQPVGLYATFYAPNHDMTMNGNPQIYGAIVAHNFSGNGSTGFHYDKQLGGGISVVTDYRIASFVEDVR